MSLLDYPYGAMSDEARAVHFTFASSLVAALNVEFLAAVAPATYLTVFARLDVAAKALMVTLPVLNHSQEDPRRQAPGSHVTTHYLSAALSTFREATRREFIDSSTSAETLFALAYFNFNL